jgi:hypothetical protein
MTSAVSTLMRAPLRGAPPGGADRRRVRLQVRGSRTWRHSRARNPFRRWLDAMRSTRRAIEDGAPATTSQMSSMRVSIAPVRATTLAATPAFLTAPSQNNHMLKGKIRLVAGATSDIGHNGFGAADDIEVRLRNLTERHGMVLRRDAAIMSLPTVIEAMMRRAPKKFGRGKRSWAKTSRAQPIPCVWYCWGQGPEPSAVSAFQRDLGSRALGLRPDVSSLPTSSDRMALPT